MAQAPAAARQLADVATPITGAAEDYDALVDRIGDARFVLLGEASHGTHEFYRERAELTKRLILERGVTAVAVEADWPDAYRVNAYVRGRSSAANAEEALRGFQRFPTWMWRNTVVVDFIEWLRDHNERLSSSGTPVGFYGLDLYNLYGSIEAVLQYLERVDPEAAARARYRYACFGDTGEDSRAYGYSAAFDLSKSCEDEAVQQLLELREQASALAAADGRVGPDDQFHAEQSARVVKGAEEYYRSMFGSRISTWNLRDRHMADTLDELSAYLDQSSATRSRVAVWEHNSHLGDARATEMGRRGEFNVGQLARERHGEQVFSVGMTTYSGTVSAASNWDAPLQRKRVRPALPGSYESLLHQLEVPACTVITDEAEALGGEPRLERAIGVIYRPESERLSHYFLALMQCQFDAVLHIDETTALEPLEPTAQWTAGEPPETYPFGQ